MSLIDQADRLLMDHKQPDAFRKVPHFDFCGVAPWAGVYKDGAAIMIGDAIMSVERARDLRDWLNAALPADECEANAAPDLAEALRQLTNGFKYSAEVCSIARAALAKAGL